MLTSAFRAALVKKFKIETLSWKLYNQYIEILKSNFFYIKFINCFLFWILNKYAKDTCWPDPIFLLGEMLDLVEHAKLLRNNKLRFKVDRERYPYFLEKLHTTKSFSYSLLLLLYKPLFISQKTLLLFIHNTIHPNTNLFLHNQRHYVRNE